MAITPPGHLLRLAQSPSTAQPRSFPLLPQTPVVSPISANGAALSLPGTLILPPPSTPLRSPCPTIDPEPTPCRRNPYPTVNPEPTPHHNPYLTGGPGPTPHSPATAIDSGLASSTQEILENPISQDTRASQKTKSISSQAKVRSKKPYYRPAPAPDKPLVSCLDPTQTTDCPPNREESLLIQESSGPSSNHRKSPPTHHPPPIEDRKQYSATAKDQYPTPPSPQITVILTRAPPTPNIVSLEMVQRHICRGLGSTIKEMIIATGPPGVENAPLPGHPEGKDGAGEQKRGTVGGPCGRRAEKEGRTLVGSDSINCIPPLADYRYLRLYLFVSHGVGITQEILARLPSASLGPRPSLHPLIWL
ncbi:hypothetical protein P691DRAFT_807719, partial [Macrolepiota fuliginosa MF-IS2]